MPDKLCELIMKTESEAPPSDREIAELYVTVVDDIAARIQRAREMEDSSIYGDLKFRIDELRGDMRESIQAITRKAMWQIILKLRRGGDISHEEMKLIRLWVVGDAEAYVEEENKFDDWIAELTRLEEEIRKLRAGSVEVDRLEQLNALLTDARGATRRISLFLNDRERVQRYESSVRNGLDESARNVLANILARSYNDPSV